LLQLKKDTAHPARRIMQTDMGWVKKVSTPQGDGVCLNSAAPAPGGRVRPGAGLRLSGQGEWNTAAVTGTVQPLHGTVSFTPIFKRTNHHAIPAAAGRDTAFKTFKSETGAHRFRLIAAFKGATLHHPALCGGFLFRLHFGGFWFCLLYRCRSFSLLLLLALLSLQLLLTLLLCLYLLLTLLLLLLSLLSLLLQQLLLLCLYLLLTLLLLYLLTL